MSNNGLFSKLRQVHRNIYIMGYVSLAIQFGATLVYSTADTFTGAFMTPIGLLIMRSFSESMSTTIKIVAGMLSDYFNNRKLLLSISYGSLIIIKIIFTLCIIAGNFAVKMPQYSNLLLYISYIYVITHIIDRIMSCLRDAPQAAIMLESIKESNKHFIASGDETKANDNVLFSLGVRKAIGSLGSILGGIASYLILKFNLLSNTTVYICSIVPLIIGNIILYFGVRELSIQYEKEDNEYYEVNESNYDEESFVVNVEEIKPHNKLMTYLNDIETFINSKIHIFSIIYYIVSAFIAYKHSSSRLIVIACLCIYNILFFAKNKSIVYIIRLLLLFTLQNNYGILIALIIFTFVCLMSDNNNIKFSFMNLLSLNQNTIYTILFYIFSMLMIDINATFILFLLNAGLVIFNHYFNDKLTLYVTISMILMAQFKILLITQNLFFYVVFVILSTVNIFTTYDYLFILPKQLIQFVKYISLGSSAYVSLYYISNIISHINFSSILTNNTLSDITSSISTFISMNNTNNEDNNTSIINNYKWYFISFISLGLKIISNIFNVDYLNTNSNSIIFNTLEFTNYGTNTIDLLSLLHKSYKAILMLIIMFVVILICILNVSILSFSTRIFLAVALAVICFGILSYYYNSHLRDYFAEYKSYLYAFIYTVLTLCMLHIGRFNDTFFFSHGVNFIQNITKTEIPLIFTFLYIIIAISSFLLSYIKKYKDLLFLIIAISLIGSNLLLMSHSLFAFILSLILLGIYSSGNEVLFISLIKEVIPQNNKTNGTFLGIYYLCMSITSILNAMIAVQLTNNPQIGKYLVVAFGMPILENTILLKIIIFSILPITSIILWFSSRKYINDSHKI